MDLSSIDVAEITKQLSDKGLDIGIKLVGALLLWWIGLFLVKKAVDLASRAMVSRKVDDTLIRYVGSALNVVLRVALVVAIMGYLGVETTTFAALLAGVGLAVGTAWGGLLAHFAAGAFIVGLRPYSVGDFITAGGVTGTVTEIGLFVTTINTMDNVLTIVGNNKIFSDNIQNFTRNPFRRVDLKAQLDHTVDVNVAITKLKAKLATIPNVSKEQAPEVHVLEFTLAGPVLAVRPYVHNDFYWDVYFATNKSIVEVGGTEGFAVPKQHFNVRQ